MNYTNELGLPAPLAAALTKDTYSRGDASYSATGLLRPPRMAALFDDPDNIMFRDVSENLWTLFGTAVHSILEDSKHPDFITEERLYCSVSGVKLSGAIDVQHIQKDGTRILQDYKTRKAYGVMNNDSDEKQLNIYAYIAHKNGIKVSGLQIINFVKDWSRHEAERKPDYPPQDIYIQNIPLWPIEQTEAFVVERIAAHEEARAGNLPDCTDEERWLREDKFAVMKEKRVRAVRVFDSQEEAETFIAAQKDADKHTIDHRRGQPIRCEQFCDVADYCDQFATFKQENSGE
jgi:hypothetical protein|tara:strand:- start:3278 stop:4147 length:870 start_codon:yes stop_codon:yes gene_type:complete